LVIKEWYRKRFKKTLNAKKGKKFPEKREKVKKAFINTLYKELPGLFK
jgi:hypothetical protein